MKQLNVIILLFLVVLATSCNSEDNNKTKTENMNENPLLTEFTGEFGTIPFSKIKTEHFMPAINKGVEEGNAEILKISSNKEEPSFSNTIEALEATGSLLSRASSVLGHLNSAETNAEIQTAQREASPLLTKYYNDIIFNQELFERIKVVYDKRESLGLNIEESTLLENTYKSFTKNGALLDSAKKEELRKVNTRLSELSISFGENSLAETNENWVVVTNENELLGLSSDDIAKAEKVAQEKELSNSWVFTLHGPSYVAVMKKADNRSLREKMYKAYKAQGNQGNKNDNRENVKEIVALRLQKANLLGYATYADFVLADRMAKSSDEVVTFLDNLLALAKPVALKEKEDVQEFINRTDKFELQAWDWTYYSNKLKKEKYNINDDDLKPYFQLEKVQAGMFEIANKLYGIKFNEIENIETWHEDVTVFEVVDEDNEHLAVFYTDYYPRAGKRGGAWMNSLRKAQIKDGERIRPHVINICSFTPPTDTKPSLLTFREVETMFHEFGHGLHGMLANTKYESLSGTSVYRDFVELPSQIMENWVSEPEALALFAKHYETEELIPSEMVDKILESSNFNEGYGTVRQLSFGFLDMGWHSMDKADIDNLKTVEGFEQVAFANTDIFPSVENDIMSTQFGHLFAGGYAAGYYGYKWAEVLDADAFQAFKEVGIFDKGVAEKFRTNILEKGGTEHPAVLYKRFRGSDPSPEALAKRAGFIK